MVVASVLPNDCYIVSDFEGFRRTLRSNYKQTVAADRMRPWVSPGGVSNDTDAESGEDGIPLTSDEESN